MTNADPPDQGLVEEPPRGRRTPYELVFTSGDFESRIFPTIRDEALAQKVDPLHRERFDFLTTPADVVRSLTPDDAPPDAIEQYRAMLYHAYNFWSAGRRLYVVETAAARYLVEASPMLEGWDFATPAASLYVQLPARLFWASITPDSTPEPIDGFFVALAQGEDAFGKPFTSLELLVVLGIRRDRAGFSVIPLETALGPGIPAVWADAEPRPEGDFTNTLPGGEIAGLYSILTTAELLKLVGRTFWYADRFDHALVEARAPEPRDEERGEPPNTRLAYTRITLEPVEGPDDVP